MNCKTIILHILCFISLSVYAQESHLTFMTIPIDGSVDRFQERLSEYGFNVDDNDTLALPVGTRQLRGKFLQNEMIVHLLFNPKNNKMYEVKAFVHSDSESMIRGEYSAVRSSSLQMTPRNYHYDREKNGFPTFKLLEMREKESGLFFYHDVLGVLGLHIDRIQENDHEKFVLVMDFQDTTNCILYEGSLISNM